VPTLYEWAGGRGAIGRMIGCFYDRVERDDLLSPLFPGGVSTAHREHVTTWWCEVLGGPAGYTERLGGYPAMLAHHRDTAGQHALDTAHDLDLGRAPFRFRRGAGVRRGTRRLPGVHAPCPRPAPTSAQGLPEVATALAVLTGERHPLAPEGAGARADSSPALADEGVAQHRYGELPGHSRDPRSST
jgi:hypothetical protein